MIDIHPKYLELIKHILKDHVPQWEVRAFGSRVIQSAQSHSDIDLVIMGDSSLSLGVIGSLKEAFQASDLSIRVDVLDWHSISEDFQKVIERKYEVIQSCAKGT